VIGNKKTRKEVEEQLQQSPIYLCGDKMKQEDKAKYLGDWLSSFGLADSVSATVMKRKGLAVYSIHEIRAVVDDCRSLVCGGLEAGLDIWEMAVSCQCSSITPHAGWKYHPKLSMIWKESKDSFIDVSLQLAQDAQFHDFIGKLGG
jgi:hypothetical protein